MKLDIGQTILELEKLNEHVGYPCTGIANAIKIIKMWRDVKRDSCEFELIKCIEEDYFPSLVTKTITVKVEVPLKGGLARVTQIKNYTKSMLKIFSDVKEVTVDDEDC